MASPISRKTSETRGTVSPWRGENTICGFPVSRGRERSLDSRVRQAAKKPSPGKRRGRCAGSRPASRLGRADRRCLAEHAFDLQRPDLLSPGEQRKPLCLSRASATTPRFLRLQRTGGVDQPASFAQGASPSREDAPGDRADGRNPPGDPIPYFRVAGQGSGSTAGRVAEHQVELALKRQLGGIENAKTNVPGCRPSSACMALSRAGLMSQAVIEAVGLRSARMAVFPPGAAQQSRMAGPRPASSAISCDPSS